MASAFLRLIVATKIMIVPMGPMKQTVHQTQVYLVVSFKKQYYLYEKSTPLVTRSKWNMGEILAFLA